MALGIPVVPQRMIRVCWSCHERGCSAVVLSSAACGEAAGRGARALRWLRVLLPGLLSGLAKSTSPGCHAAGMRCCENPGVEGRSSGGCLLGWGNRCGATEVQAGVGEVSLRTRLDLSQQDFLVRNGGTRGVKVFGL